MQLGPPLRPQASHTVQIVQQPNSQHGIPRRSAQQVQRTMTQEPAVKQPYIKPTQQKSRRVEQRGCPRPTLQQNAVERPLQQGAQRTTSQQPLHTTVTSSTSGVLTNLSPNFQPLVSSLLGIPPTSVQHTGAQKPAVKHDKPQQSRCIEQQHQRPLQQGANSQPPQCTLPSRASAVIPRSQTIQTEVSPEYDFHFPVSAYIIMHC